MHNSMMAFTFSILYWKYPFLTYLVQKSKVVSLSWKLVPRLIRLCRIQWWCSVFPFSTVNTLFMGNSFQKMKIASLSWDLVHWLIWIFRIQWWCLINLVQDMKIVSFSDNLVRRLTWVCKIQWLPSPSLFLFLTRNILFFWLIWYKKIPNLSI